MKAIKVINRGVFLTVLFGILTGCNKADSRQSETVEPVKQMDTLEIASRKNENKIIDKSDSIRALYGDRKECEKKMRMITDKK